MSRSLTLLLTVVLSLPALAQTKPAAPLNTTRMEQIIQAHVADKSFMGAVLVARSDQVVLSKAYGSADLEWNVPNIPGGKFRLGSVAKQFTAAAILLLEERGKLSVNDPVKKHLPDSPPAWDAVTLHHLLTHTSGISNLTDLGKFPDYYAKLPLKTTPAETIARFKDRPLDFAPGERMSYSNSGYIVLGAVIEKITGLPYAQFMQENVFTPLGMKDTGYDTADRVLPQRVRGYQAEPDGTIINPAFIHMSIPFSAGGFYSTTADMLRWQLALTGGKLLKPDTFTKMSTPFKGEYAYGLNVRPLAGHTTYSHGGGIEGFNTFTLYCVEDQLSVIVLGNLSGRAPQNIARYLTQVAHGQPVQLAADAKKLPAKLLAEYVGTYRFAPDFAMDVTLEGDLLHVQATRQRKAPIYAESETIFFATVVDAKFEFVRDAAGKITMLILRQGGREMKATRE